MGRIKEKILTLDEQINFVHEGRRLLQNNPDTEIIWRDDAVTMLRHIEENLNTIKMWINLPHHHQAALHALDATQELPKEYLKKIEGFTGVGPFLHQINEFVLSALTSEDDDHDEIILERIAALAILGLSKCVIAKHQKKD